MLARPAGSRCVSGAPSMATHGSPGTTLDRVRISVRLFAGLRQRAGGSHVEVELPEGAVVGDLLGATGATPVGALQPGQGVAATHREDAPASAPVGPDDEVALIPPVSGGAGPVSSGAGPASGTA